MNLQSPVKPGAFNYLLDDIHHERRVRLDDLVHDEQPPPPPREPKRRRTHITIELVPVPRRAKKRRSWAGAVVVWTIVGLILISLAHGQPTQWRSYQEGHVTRLQGDDGSTGTSYQQGFVTHFEMTAPDGRTTRCRSWKQGFQTLTECDR